MRPRYPQLKTVGELLKFLVDAVANEDLDVNSQVIGTDYASGVTVFISEHSRERELWIKNV
jgi:hypothetical protein